MINLNEIIIVDISIVHEVIESRNNSYKPNFSNIFNTKLKISLDELFELNLDLKLNKLINNINISNLQDLNIYRNRIDQFCNKNYNWSLIDFSYENWPVINIGLYLVPKYDQLLFLTSFNPFGPSYYTLNKYNNEINIEVEYSYMMDYFNYDIFKNYPIYVEYRRAYKLKKLNGI